MVLKGILAAVLVYITVFQTVEAQSTDSAKYLLMDIQLQLEITDAVNAMYNFDFFSAERDYRFLRQRFGTHPLPYFLLGLNTWWKIVPNPDIEKYDPVFHAYMDTAIFYADKIHEGDKGNLEATFFLAAAYGFKGRLYSDRKSWRKATFAGKNAVKYMQISKGQNALSPEFLFGDAIYNYYSIWVPENYPLLRPIVAMFPKGDKELGLKQLREVAMNSFYTRTEAQTFLMKIYANEESRPRDAYPLAEYLAKTFPNNPYFHRFYCRILYSEGKLFDCENCSKRLLEKLDSGYAGYEEVGGRYASFYLGYIHKFVKRNNTAAKDYFSRTVEFSERTGSYSAGYYLYALNYLAKTFEEESNLYKAAIFHQKVLNTNEKDSPTYKDAKAFFKENKKRKLKKLKPPTEEG